MHRSSFGAVLRMRDARAVHRGSNGYARPIT
jgi:hypothetical protein